MMHSLQIAIEVLKRVKRFIGYVDLQMFCRASGGMVIKLIFPKCSQWDKREDVTMCPEALHVCFYSRLAISFQSQSL